LPSEQILFWAHGQGLGAEGGVRACPKASLGVTELARQLSLDKANVHRLLQVLALKGYACQDPASRQWSVTVQLVSLARGVLRNLDVRSVAEPEVRALVDRTGEAAHLALRTRKGGVYILQERPHGGVSVDTEVGSAPVMHATATGKALLAWLERAEWRALVSVPLRRCTDRTIVTLGDLATELAKARPWFCHRRGGVPARRPLCCCAGIRQRGSRGRVGRRLLPGGAFDR
jgi:DNA-binding IclR family transcriptional regulator